jgi:hypothetical protein
LELPDTPDTDSPASFQIQSAAIYNGSSPRVTSRTSQHNLHLPRPVNRHSTFTRSGENNSLSEQTQESVDTNNTSIWMHLSKRYILYTIMQLYVWLYSTLQP